MSKKKSILKRNICFDGESKDDDFAMLGPPKATGTPKVHATSHHNKKPKMMTKHTYCVTTTSVSTQTGTPTMVDYTQLTEERS